MTGSAGRNFCSHQGGSGFLATRLTLLAVSARPLVLHESQDLGLHRLGLPPATDGSLPFHPGVQGAKSSIVVKLNLLH